MAKAAVERLRKQPFRLQKNKRSQPSTMAKAAVERLRKRAPVCNLRSVTYFKLLGDLHAAKQAAYKQASKRASKQATKRVSE